MLLDSLKVFLRLIYIFSLFSLTTIGILYAGEKSVNSLDLKTIIESPQGSTIFNNETQDCVPTRNDCTFGFVQLPSDLNMFYRVEGPKEGIPLVLLHGGGLTSLMFSNLVETLLNQYNNKNLSFRVWRLDSRGHGLTQNPMGSFSYSLLANDIHEFIISENQNKKKIENPILLGCSDGGIAAFEYIANFPKETRGLITFGATPVIVDRTHYREGMDLFYVPRPDDSEGSLKNAHASTRDLTLNDTWLKKLMSDPKNVKFYQDRHLDGLATLKNGWLTWANPENATETLKKIRTPVELILGDKDQFFTIENAKEACAAINSESSSNCALTIINHAGHEYSIVDKSGFSDLVFKALLKINNR